MSPHPGQHWRSCSVWSVHSDQFEVEAYVGVGEIGVRCAQGETIWRERHTTATLQEQFVSILAQEVPLAGRMRVWVSGALARPFVIQPESAARTVQERKMIGIALAKQSGALTGSPQVWVEPFPRHPRSLCVAMDSELLQQLHGTASATGMSLKSVRPTWNRILDVLHEPAPGGAVVKYLRRKWQFWRMGKAPLESGAMSESVEGIIGLTVWSLAEPDSLTLLVQRGHECLFAETFERSEMDPGWILAVRRFLAVHGLADPERQRFVWQHQIKTRAQKPLPNRFVTIPIGSIEQITD